MHDDDGLLYTTRLCESSSLSDVRALYEHVAKLRDDVDTKRAEHDADRAEHRADDAMFALEFSYSAIEEAEYGVLDAELARGLISNLSGARAELESHASFTLSCCAVARGGGVGACRRLHRG